MPTAGVRSLPGLAQRLRAHSLESEKWTRDTRIWNWRKERKRHKEWLQGRELKGKGEKTRRKWKRYRNWNGSRGSNVRGADALWRREQSFSAKTRRLALSLPETLQGTSSIWGTPCLVPLYWVCRERIHLEASQLFLEPSTYSVYRRSKWELLEVTIRYIWNSILGVCILLRVWAQVMGVFISVYATSLSWVNFTTYTTS
jgi:hypothetical protein